MIELRRAPSGMGRWDLWFGGVCIAVRSKKCEAEQLKLSLERKYLAGK